MQVPRGNLLAHIAGRRDRPFRSIRPRTVRARLPAQVRAGLVRRSRHLFRPGKEVRGLLRQQAATFFLVQKQDRPRGKALTPRGFHGSRRIALAQSCRRGAGLLCTENLRIQPSVPQRKKAEPCIPELLPLARPAIRACSRRPIKPEARKGKVLMQLRKPAVSRVVIAIKPHELARCLWSNGHTFRRDTDRSIRLRTLKKHGKHGSTRQQQPSPHS